MAIKRNKRFHAEIPTSSLSDIMFFLFLFFLIISTLANPNVIKLTLPKAASNESTNKDHISLSVTEDKLYYIDKQEVAFENLEQMLLEKTSISGPQREDMVARIERKLYDLGKPEVRAGDIGELVMDELAVESA